MKRQPRTEHQSKTDTFHTPLHINPTTTHFTDEDTEAERPEGDRPRFHSGKVAELEFDPSSA